MKIIKNSVVTLKYEVFDGQGSLLERGSEPLVYLHGGYGGIFPKVEEALAGKDAGELTTTQRGRDLSRAPQSGHHNIGFRCAA